MPGLVVETEKKLQEDDWIMEDDDDVDDSDEDNDSEDSDNDAEGSFILLLAIQVLHCWFKYVLLVHL